MTDDSKIIVRNALEEVSKHIATLKKCYNKMKVIISNEELKEINVAIDKAETGIKNAGTMEELMKYFKDTIKYKLHDLYRKRLKELNE